MHLIESKSFGKCPLDIGMDRLSAINKTRTMDDTSLSLSFVLLFWWTNVKLERITITALYRNWKQWRAEDASWDFKMVSLLFSYDYFYSWEKLINKFTHYFCFVIISSISSCRVTTCMSDTLKYIRKYVMYIFLCGLQLNDLVALCRPSDGQLAYSHKAWNSHHEHVIIVTS